MLLIADPLAQPEFWSLAFAGRPSFHFWDGEDQAVTYNPATGDTHLIDLLALELLELLGQSAGPLEQIAARMAGVFDTQVEPAQIAERIESTLLQLQDAGLVTSSAA